jgi:hypothetical protein
MRQSQARVETFSQSTLFTESIRKERYRLPASFFFRRFFSPGLSRCGVSDGTAPQRGASRIDV